MSSILLALIAGALAPSTPTHPAAGWRDSAIVFSDGARLFVDLRGADSTLPVLLVLHGGPGEIEHGLWSLMAYPGPGLEQDFVVAYLYQRGLARSSPVPIETQTLAQHVRDVDAVVGQLAARFHRPKIFIVGHSWGAALGWVYVRAHREKVAGFAAVSGPSSFPTSERAGYEAVSRWAARTDNATAVAELKQIGPPPWTDFAKIAIERKWAVAATGRTHFDFDADRLLAASGLSRVDSSWSTAGREIASHLAPQLMQLTVEAEFPRLDVPALFIVGEEDAIVPVVAVRQGYDRYRGRKRLSVFAGSGHFPYVDDADRFVRELLSFFRP
jgi:pimeloyl-ACP methyl ester carboxylesterase